LRACCDLHSRRRSQPDGAAIPWSERVEMTPRHGQKMCERISSSGSIVSASASIAAARLRNHSVSLDLSELTASSIAVATRTPETGYTAMDVPIMIFGRSGCLMGGIRCSILQSTPLNIVARLGVPYPSWSGRLSRLSRASLGGNEGCGRWTLRALISALPQHLENLEHHKLHLS
jgi:hypothetical protein